MAGQLFTVAELRRTYFWLFNFHKYYLENGSINPELDDLSSKIIELRTPTHPNHENALIFFGETITEFLRKRYFPEGSSIYLAFVPSHQKGQPSEILIKLADYIKKIYSVKNTFNPLVRTKTIHEYQEGDFVDLIQHYKSIKVDKNHLSEGCTVLLLDMLITSGNGLTACRNLLYDAGAGLVAGLAIAKKAE